MPQYGLLCVEDNQAFASWLEESARVHPDIAFVDTAETLAAAQDALRERRYDIVAIDLRLPDGDGSDLLRDPNLQGRKIVVTVAGDEASVVHAISLGADGYVLKDDANLFDAIVDAGHGNSPLSPSVASFILKQVRESTTLEKSGALRPNTNNGLSPREIEILQTLATGHTYSETASKLGISHHTVADHIKSIYRKLAVNSSAAAVYKGIAAGLLPVDNV